MNKRKTIQRLVATSIMTAFTAASLITTSFAFVTLNKDASISEFTFDIVDQEGLLLSVDGDHFFQDMDLDTIKSAIIKNQPDGVDELSKIHLTGVTLGGHDNQAEPYQAGLYKEQYTYKIGQYESEITDERLTFVKDKVTWLDKNEETDASAIAAAKTADTTGTLTNLFGKNDRVGVHTYQAATKGDYIFFDLWLRVAQNGIADSEDHPTYELKFTDRTEIVGSGQNVEIYNKLTVPDAFVPSGDTHLDGSAISEGNYFAGDKITVNPANAMRLGINVLNDSQTNQTNAAATNTYTNIRDSLTIFEPNAGLGSYAVNNTYATTGNYARDNDYFKPTTNAMYTYYNSLNPLAPFLGGVDATPGQIETDLAFTDDVIAEFKWTPAQNGGSYNVVKMSVMLWLEGWDADYFVGLNNTAITVRLGFAINEKQQNNG